VKNSTLVQPQINTFPLWFARERAAACIFYGAAMVTDGDYRRIGREITTRLPERRKPFGSKRAYTVVDAGKFGRGVFRVETALAVADGRTRRRANPVRSFFDRQVQPGPG